MQRSLSKILLVLLFVQASSWGYSRDIPTVQFTYMTGMDTYKSKLVKSNDTSVSGGYTLSLWGGVEKTINMELRSDSGKTGFEHSETNTTSAVEASFFDTVIRVRWGFLYLGVLFTRHDFIINFQGEDYIDGVATGTGFNTGFSFPVGRSSRLFFDMTSSSTSLIRELNQAAGSVEFGSRTDVLIGGAIGVTRSLLDVILGYRQRSFTISVGGESSTESVTSTILGLAFNGYF